MLAVGPVLALVMLVGITTLALYQASESVDVSSNLITTWVIFEKFLLGSLLFITMLVVGAGIRKFLWSVIRLMHGYGKQFIIVLISLTGFVYCAFSSFTSIGIATADDFPSLPSTPTPSSPLGPMSSPPDLIDRGEAIKITDSTESSEEVSLALDSLNNAHFVWAEDGEIYYKALGDTGITNISNTEIKSDLPVIAIDSEDTIHIVWDEGWEDLTPPGWVYYIKSEDLGQTWSTPILVSDHNQYNRGYHGNLVVDNDDRIHLIWATAHTGFWEVYHRYISNTGVWSTKEKLGDGAHPDIAAAPDGDVYAVWQNQFVDLISGEVESKRWDSSSGWDTSAVQLSDGNDESLKPAIAIDHGGTVHVAWHHYSGGVPLRGEIEYRYKTGGSSSWSDIEQVGDSNGEAFLDVDIAVLENEPTLVFNIDDDMILTTRHNENWTSPGLLISSDHSPGSNKPVKIAFSSDGRLHFTIDAVENSYRNIYYAQLMPELLDRMIWGAGQECPSNSTQSSVWWAGGPINTRNGNLSYQETDFFIPVRGCGLDFRRSYASQAIDVYTSTMGHGWTHNFDMRLHFSGNVLTNTVEFQTHGGSRLPFFDNGDGTYTPYPGVTAQLAQVTSTYVLTAFDQTVYTFDQDGLLLKKQDPHGNSIIFTYNGNSRLLTAAQRDRILTYTYDVTTGYLSSVSDNADRTVELGYKNGNLVAVTDTLGLKTSYYYSATASPYLLTEVVDPSGIIVEKTEYDAERRAYRQWDGMDNLLVEIDYTITDTHIVSEVGQIMTHTYDSQGTLVAVTHTCSSGSPGCGNGSDMDYDGNFKPREVIDANGHATTMLWNSGGSNLESLSNALDQTTSLSYDSFNNLTQVINARGMTTTYGYHDLDFPTFRTHVTDTLGNVTLYIPTEAGLLGQIEDANGVIISYTYNYYGQVTQVINGVGSLLAVTTTYGYDEVGRLITTTETSASESHTTLSVFDDDRLKASIANWTGNDPGNWQADCDTSEGERDTNICTRYLYDDAGRTISTTNTLDQTDLTFYDDAGRVAASVANWDGSAYTGYGDLCDFVTPDPETNICSLAEYDSFGRVYTTTDSLGRETVTEYDALGRVRRTVANWQDGVFNPADPDADIVTQYEYDAVGNTILVTDTLTLSTRTIYDELNRVIGVVENWSGSITDTAGLANCVTPSAQYPARRDHDICTLYAYDEVGNTIIVTDTLGRMNRTFYDELNRVSFSVQNWQGDLTAVSGCNLTPANPDDENICTLYGYDPAGNQITVTNALSQTSLTVYDDLNRPYIQVANWDLTTVIGAPGDCTFNASADENLCTITSYDALGRRSSTKNPLGQVTTFTYDGLGRVITTTRTLDGQDITTGTGYDALGNRLHSTDANGHDTSFEYDTLNRLVTTTSPEGVEQFTFYDTAGRVVSTTNSLDEVTLNEYDDLDRLVSANDPISNTTTYVYDALGNRVAMVDAENVRTGYRYDGLNRLVTVLENWDNSSACAPGASAVEDNLCTQYVYDALGNRVVVTNALAVSTTLTLYDDLNRPVMSADALGNQTTYTYDALGNRTVMTDANGDITYNLYDGLNRVISTTYVSDVETVLFAYDALGNRTMMTDALGTTSYIYDDLNRLITVTNPFTAVVGYSYDYVGNRTRLIYPDSRVVTYTYDLDNRLIRVEDWDTSLTRYQYDPAGRLITTTLPNDIATIYTYDSAGRLLQLQHVITATDELIAEYVYAYDKVGNRTAVTETMLLPDLGGGQATLPAGFVDGADAPHSAGEVIAAIHPAALDEPDKGRQARLLHPDAATPAAPVTQPLTVTHPLLLADAEPLPFDAEELAEQARNQWQVGADGRVFVDRPAHSATFDQTGVMSFRLHPVLTPTADLPMDASAPLTLTVSLAEVTWGRRPAPIFIQTAQPDLDGHVLRYTRLSQMVEEFVATDAGIEQRWWIENPPFRSDGDLTLALEATTALTLTTNGDGFVFSMLTPDGELLPVARYGRAVAIDNTGDTQWASFAATELPPDERGWHRYRLEMTFPANWLAVAEYPLLIDPLLSNLVRLEQDGPANDQKAVQVAYNPDEEEFLLVWADKREGNWDIYGQRVNEDGALLDENFIVTDVAYDQQTVHVAYGNNVYLVAWSDGGSTGTAYDTMGAIISGTGQIVTNSLPIAIDSGSADKEVPNDVVYNSDNGQFLVIWQDRATGNWNIWGRYVAKDGALGTPIQISSQAGNHEDNAAGVYNAGDDEFLVAWESYTTGDHKVEGQRISGAGSLLGSVLDIGDGSDDERQLDIAYLDTAERYVVVWRDDRNSGTTGYDIYSQLVETDGTLDGTNFVITNTAASEANPYITVDAATGGAIIAWQRNNGGAALNDLYGRVVDNNGDLTNESLAVQTENKHQEIPVFVQNSNGDFLFAWQDERFSNYDIFTRMLLAGGVWGGAGMAHPAPGDQKNAQIAYNPDDDQYLVVWQDYRNGSDWNVYGQLVTHDGSLMGKNLEIDLTIKQHQIVPHVAYGNGEYLVTWQHYVDTSNTTYDVYGRGVNPDGSFAGSAFVIANATDPVTMLPYKESPTDVMYNSTSDQFLVLWTTKVAADNWDFWARHVTPTVAVGSYITVATTAETETDAAGFYNPDNDQYLVVWEAITDTHTVYGRRLTGSGVVTHTDTLQISNDQASNAAADVVYRPDAGQYVVVWQQEGDIYSRVVLPDGALSGSETALAAENDFETHPRLAVDAQGMLVVWQRASAGGGFPEFDLYGRMLDADGITTGNTFAIQETAGDQQNVAVAYGGGNRFQLAWQDNREGGWDLFTAFLDNDYQFVTIQYNYDPLYRLTNADYSRDIIAEYIYEYDGVGNMTAYTETITSIMVVTRSFDNANRLEISVQDGVTTTYTYDDNGNLTTIDPPGASGTIRYGYDLRNLMITSTLDGSAVASFAYDGMNNRLRQVDFTGATVITTTYVNDILGLTQVLIADDGATQVANLFGLDLIHQDSGTETRTLLADGLGSVRLEMVGDAVETNTTYSPYGKELAQEGTSDTVYGFTGEQEDDSTGLLYLRARYYSSDVHAFLSKDRGIENTEMPTTLNGWSYVNGNPVNLADSSGLQPDIDCNRWPIYSFVIMEVDLQSLCRQASGPDSNPETINARERIYRLLAIGGAIRGGSFAAAAKMLDHFLDGNGNPMTLQLNENSGFVNDPGITRATREFREPRVPGDEPDYIIPLLHSFLGNHVKPIVRCSTRLVNSIGPVPLRGRDHYFNTGRYEHPVFRGEVLGTEPRAYDTGYFFAYGHVTIDGEFTARSVYSSLGDLYVIDYDAEYTIQDVYQWYPGKKGDLPLPGTDPANPPEIPHEWAYSLTIATPARAHNFAFTITWIERKRLSVLPDFSGFIQLARW